MASRLDYWRVCTDFTVVQAALIACGVAPDSLQYEVERNSSKHPEGYVPLRSAFQNALNSGRLKPSKPAFNYDHEGEPTPYFDIESTTIAAEEIDRFLKSVGVSCEFFDRGTAEPAPEALTSMPAKLSAAVKAWTAVSSDPARVRGKSPKQALEQWLTEHAAELGLLNRAGQLNRTGIEEICKVANWKPSGGAPATPAASVSMPTAKTERPILRFPLPPEGGFSSGPRRTRNLPDDPDDIPF